MSRIILDGVRKEDRDRALLVADMALANAEMRLGQHFGYDLWCSEVPHVNFFVWKNRQGVTVRATYRSNDQ